LGEAADGEEILDFAERAALLAEAHNGFRRGGADGGERLKFLNGGGVEVEGFCRERFLGLGRGERETNQERNCAQQYSRSEEIQKQIPRFARDDKHNHIARLKPGATKTQQNRSGQAGKPALQNIAAGVADFERAEERGLLLDLRAVADDDDLRVGGVEMLARGGEHVRGA